MVTPAGPDVQVVLGLVLVRGRRFHVEAAERDPHLPTAQQLQIVHQEGLPVHGHVAVQIEQVPAARLFGEQVADDGAAAIRSEEHTSELQSLMRISYAVFCLKKKKS